jgi:hypothetical protein
VYERSQEREDGYNERDDSAALAVVVIIDTLDPPETGPTLALMMTQQNSLRDVFILSSLTYSFKVVSFKLGDLQIL